MKSGWNTLPAFELSYKLGWYKVENTLINKFLKARLKLEEDTHMDILWRGSFLCVYISHSSCRMKNKREDCRSKGPLCDDSKLGEGQGFCFTFNTA